MRGGKGASLGRRVEERLRAQGRGGKQEGRGKRRHQQQQLASERCGCSGQVTYEAVAKAAGTTLELHEATVERVRARPGPLPSSHVSAMSFVPPHSLAQSTERRAPPPRQMRAHYSMQGKELNEARLRMATLPAGAEVLFTDGLWVPLVNCGEVYVLPGIPRLFQGMLGANMDRFQGPSMHSEALYTRRGEGDIAQTLGEIAARFPQVNIGSYPNVKASDEDRAYTTKLNFE